MKKTMVKVALFGCAAAGVLLWFGGYYTLGLGLVIAGYVFYIVIRLVPKRSRAADDDEKEEEEQEPPANPDSWEEMREKAFEALNRKRRGQKIDVASFFRPAHAGFPALVKVRADISDGASDLVLRTDSEILKLRRDSDETERLLNDIPGRVESEEDLQREIERLRTSAQP
jgi:hypothetical protein